MDHAGSGPRSLLRAQAVRERARAMLALADAGRLLHFTLHRDRLPACADLVVETIRDAYPTLDVPFHARWRHFTAGGIDRWAIASERVVWGSPAHRARAAFELAIVSVLLDAGAGPDWAWHERETGQTFRRSEGLGVASFRMMEAGLFSADPADPWRADADRLASLTEAELADGFQVGPANPMVGLAGRAGLLNRLGRAIAGAAWIQRGPDPARPGALFDLLVREGASVDGSVPAHAILAALLTHLGPIWPGRLARGGIDLGDTWEHPLVAPDATDGTAGLVPFHKLSQWLAYSLIEPLIDAGHPVTAIDALTGLPEYRNGGLFLDTGVLALRDPAAANRPHAVGDTLVVEWRALTVALLDEIADLVRDRIGAPAADWPLARVLEGGTWAAGRRVASRLRPGGPPPLAIVSDGTVF